MSIILLDSNHPDTVICVLYMVIKIFICTTICTYTYSTKEQGTTYSTKEQGTLFTIDTWLIGLDTFLSF